MTVARAWDALAVTATLAAVAMAYMLVTSRDVIFVAGIVIEAAVVLVCCMKRDSEAVRK